jgi:hypothetical protein
MWLQPGIGWVRGDVQTNVEVLSEINELRKLNEKQAAEIEQLKSDLGPPVIPDLAPLDQEFVVHATVGDERCEYLFTWAELFGLVGPTFFEGAQESEIASRIRRALFDRHGIFGNVVVNISVEDLDTIKFHLIALGFVRTFKMPMTNGTSPIGVILTELGKKALLEVKAVRASNSLGQEAAATE